jgi:hypothetical protein
MEEPRIKSFAVISSWIPQVRALHKSSGEKAMAELPHPWGAYLRLQERLDQSGRLDDHNRALEAGLNSIVEAVATNTVATDAYVARVVASEARRERYRAALRRRYLSVDEPRIDPNPLIEARSALRLIQSTVTAPEFALLTHVAAGYEYGGSGGKLRVRVSRLRKRLAEVA